MFTTDDDTRRPRPADPPPEVPAAVGRTPVRPLFSRHVKVRVEVEAPANEVAGVFAALAALASAADPGLAAAVRTLTENGRHAAADTTATNEVVRGLVEDVRNLDAKFADAVRAAAGFAPPDPEPEPPPTTGEHRGNPWGDDASNVM